MARSWGNARATFEGGVAAPRRGCENVFGARSSAIASPDHCILVIYLSNDLKPLSINLWRLKKRRKKKRKKVKMPKTWVVAKDTPVTVLWNYDLFAAEGHWSWPFPEACCLPRSQDRRVYIYMYIRSQSRFWVSWSQEFPVIFYGWNLFKVIDVAACVVSERFVQYKTCKWILKVVSGKKNWNCTFHQES